MIESIALLLIQGTATYMCVLTLLLHVAETWRIDSLIDRERTVICLASDNAYDRYKRAYELYKDHWKGHRPETFADAVFLPHTYMRWSRRHRVLVRLTDRLLSEYHEVRGVPFDVA